MNKLAKLILSPWIRNSWKLGVWNIGRWTIYLYIRTWWKNNYARKSRCEKLSKQQQQQQQQQQVQATLAKADVGKDAWGASAAK